MLRESIAAERARADKAEVERAGLADKIGRWRDRYGAVLSRAELAEGERDAALTKLAVAEVDVHQLVKQIDRLKERAETAEGDHAAEKARADRLQAEIQEIDRKVDILLRRVRGGSGEIPNG